MYRAIELTSNIFIYLKKQYWEKIPENLYFKESIKLFESDNFGQISKACFEFKGLCFRIW